MSQSHQGVIYSTKFHNEYLYDECYKFASDFDFEVKSFFNKELHIEKRFLPTVNFLIGGVGGSADSETEIRNIMGEHHVYSSMNTGPRARCSVELRNLTVEFISIFLL